MKNDNFLKPREDGNFIITAGFVHNLLKNTQPRMSFNEEFNVEEFKKWQKKLRGKLKELMNIPRISHITPQSRVIWNKKRKGYKIEKWEIYIEEKNVIPLLMLIPDQIRISKKLPAVLCCPGSLHTKEQLAGEPEIRKEYSVSRHPERDKMALWYAKAGIIAIAVDNPGVGELAQCWPIEKIDYVRDLISLQLIQLGWSYLGLSVYQKIRILDWIEGLEFIDKKKIAISGHSLGTEPAMVVGVIDKRIKALVFNDFVCNTLERAWKVTKLEKGHCHSSLSDPIPGFPVSGLWHTIPGLWKWFDYPDILCAFAPRPLLITEGGPTYNLLKIKKAYQILKSPDKVSIHYYPKYENEKVRKYDNATIPKNINMETYLKYAYVDVKNHCFKENLAIPWLLKIFEINKK